MTTISARELNQDVSAAKRAADAGPMITDRGRPAYVLLSATEYESLTDRRGTVDWLSTDDDIELEPGDWDSPPRAVDL